jgi:hypothetical protein
VALHGRIVPQQLRATLCLLSYVQHQHYSSTRTSNATPKSATTRHTQEQQYKNHQQRACAHVQPDVRPSIVARLSGSRVPNSHYPNITVRVRVNK